MWSATVPYHFHFKRGGSGKKNYELLKCHMFQYLKHINEHPKHVNTFNLTIINIIKVSNYFMMWLMGINCMNIQLCQHKNNTKLRPYIGLCLNKDTSTKYSNRQKSFDLDHAFFRSVHHFNHCSIIYLYLVLVLL